MSTWLPLVSSRPLSITSEPDVTSNVFCAVKVELEISSMPPRWMLTTPELVIGAGKSINCNVLVEPTGADIIRPRTARFATGVPASIVTVFVAALLMTVKSKLDDGNTPADQFVAAFHTELTALVQRFVVAAEREFKLRHTRGTHNASLDTKPTWDSLRMSNNL
jgi:hypothetical protein